MRSDNVLIRATSPRTTHRPAATALFLLFVCNPAYAATYELWNEAHALIGETRSHVTQYEETFASIARAEGVGYDALARANPGVDAWLPQPGATVVLPTSMLLPDAPRKGIVINLSEMRLYKFDESGEAVSVYPIGIGSEGTETPVMTTRTVAALENPTWYPPDSVIARHAAEGRTLARAIPAGPDNPLGRLAIQLAKPGYLIHGTNQPIGVGRRVSSGCIRMYDADIQALVAAVPNGTPVHVIRQPFKAAWDGDVLYLEAHAATSNYTDAVRRVVQATGERTATVDWQRVLEVARANTGIPTPVTQ